MRAFKVSLYLITFFVVALLQSLGNTVYAGHVEGHFAEPDYACIGPELDLYMQDIIDVAGDLEHIRLLSPAFNMTNDRGANIAAAMDKSLYSQLDGIAGNSYTTLSGTITGRVDAFLTNSGLADLGLPVLITETGEVPGSGPDANRSNDVNSNIGHLKDQMDIIKSSPKYLGAIFFNPFPEGNNDWANFNISDGDMNDICRGDCTKIGANSAGFYISGDDWYNHASNLGMNYVLEISNADESTIDGVKKALRAGMTPVIRVGTTFAAGPDSVDYAQFLVDLDAELRGNDVVYAIAGPNEPQSECWAHAACGLSVEEACNVEGSDVDVPIWFYGTVTSSLPLLDENGVYKSGQPVHGASIGLYNGWAGYSTGNKYGIVELYEVTSTSVGVPVEVDGEEMDGIHYAIEGVRKRRGGSPDGAMWAGIWCGEKFVDMWQLDLSKKVRRKDFIVPCFSDVDPWEPADEIQVTAGGRYLACEIRDEVEPRGSGATEQAPGYDGIGGQAPIELLAEDVIEKKGCVDYPGCLPVQKIETVTEEELLGRDSFCHITGTPTSGIASFFGSAHVGSISPIREGEEPEDLLPSCEELKNSMSTTSSEDDAEGRSAYFNYSVAVTLSGPGTWERLYDNAITEDPNRPICLETEGDPESVILLKDIEPPRSFSRKYKDGPFKLEPEYFPYGYIACNPNAGAKSLDTANSTKDSYEVQSGVGVLDGVRSLRYLTGFTTLFSPPEKPYKVAGEGYHTAGGPEHSFECAAFLSDPVVAKQLGLDGAAISVLSAPATGAAVVTDAQIDDPVKVNPAFRIGRPDLPVEKVYGKGDTQFRPVGICNCNHKIDPNCEDPFKDFNPETDELHETVGGFRMLAKTEDDGSFLSKVTSFLTDWDWPWLYTFGASFGLGERTDESIYKEPEPVELKVHWGSVTQQDWDPDARNGEGGFTTNSPRCVPIRSRSVSTCDGWDGNYRCDTECLVKELDEEGNVEYSSCPDSLCPSNDPNIKCEYNLYDRYGEFGTEEWAGNPDCIGDLEAPYAIARNVIIDNTIDKAMGAVTVEIASMFASPAEKFSLASVGGTASACIQHEKYPGEGSSGAVVRGAGGAAYNVQYPQRNFADPYTGPEKEQLEFVAKAPSVYNFANGSVTGFANSGNWSCKPLADGPCSVENLMKYFPGERIATIFSMICSRESGGSVRAKNFTCLDGNAKSTYDYSLGLFQVNLIDNVEGACKPSAGGRNRCKKVGINGWAEAISSTLQPSTAYGQCGDNYTQDSVNKCEPRADLAACADAYLDPDINISLAAAAASCSSDDPRSCNFSPWTANFDKCNIDQVINEMNNPPEETEPPIE